MGLHPLDLPPLRSSPGYESLRSALARLTPSPASFTAPVEDALPTASITWLTRLVASPLAWLSPGQAEEILSLGSAVLSLQCGRSAAPSMTRSFTVPTHADDTRPAAAVVIDIHEPTLTADSLGLKTWSTSFLLARRLSTIFPGPARDCGSMLELGSGTGLVGIACARVLRGHVTLTDYLDDITQNLRRNVHGNGITNGRVEWLDWTRPGESSIYHESYDLVVASDFMYDVSHPALVVDMFNHFTAARGRVLAAYPLRPSNADFIKDFTSRMAASRWTVLESGVESGYDDWGGDEGVTVHWHLYRRAAPIA
ncbi:protein of unknown function [Taphrina deformans PYCC 5710]|uniref:Uncharacterized protein n=1 Tax=Taphrina deformans (strain PYCC 5710 / ATCC 11124 / CBS 356.35 / IMI 108563 / JCM 9778 / NBRC 8474) TaxID=1097556 RepID=R4XEI8_TAPDE|nr:protein of unknown function [Taphrina deformans PYCC 5710]|eukprot:CCG84181.1 protein of unknown function [Taphrina deformans PYCC 5710]